MTKRNDRSKRVHAGWFVVLGLIALSLLLYSILLNTNISVLNPKGQIAEQQLELLISLVLIMLVIAIPALFIIYFFAYRFRETNTKTTYSPNKHNGKLFVASIWVAPSVIALIVAVVLVPATHRLAPAKEIASDKDTMTIQVVAMRWKWLFIYPEQNIATVNFVQIPIDTPVKFILTADEAPMSSFWIPNLGGQLYAMTGHTNSLNLMATESGDYPGVNAEINGKGFAGMTFTARATSELDFNEWISDVKSKPNPLDIAKYDQLLKPSENNNVELFDTSYIDLYEKVITKYAGTEEHSEDHSGHKKEEVHH